MRKVYSSPNISSCPMFSQTAITPKMRKSMSAESLNNPDFSVLQKEDLEYVATKISMDKMVSCVIYADNFPNNVLNPSVEDVNNLALCIAEPSDGNLTNKPIFTEIIEDWKQRYITFYRTIRGRFRKNK